MAMPSAHGAADRRGADTRSLDRQALLMRELAAAQRDESRAGRDEARQLPCLRACGVLQVRARAGRSAAGGQRVVEVEVKGDERAAGHLDRPSPSNAQPRRLSRAGDAIVIRPQALRTAIGRRLRMSTHEHA
jgi:hypothetical protein